MALLLLPAPASAHPLGNFTVNHYDGLRLFPDRIESTAVVDYAELPTVQERARVDADGDAQVTREELDAHAARECAALASAQVLRIDGQDLTWEVTSRSFGYEPGAGGLETSRLRCALTAPADLSRPAAVDFSNEFLADRIGWREITATGSGVTLIAPTVDATSVSDELRDYPDDLLSSPPDQRSVQLSTAPGGGPADGAAAGSTPAGPPTASGGPAGLPVSGAVEALDRAFTGIVGSDRLTAGLAVLAVGLALLVGATHAAMPGHGKTIMAAYLAGRGGRRRDALLVGLTVTVTHTAGVIVVGLLVSAFSALAGETVLGWLGITSGALVTLIGLGLLRNAWRQHHPRRGPRPSLWTTRAGRPPRLRQLEWGPRLSPSSGVPTGDCGGRSHDHSQTQGQGQAQDHSQTQDQSQAHGHGHGHGNTSNGLNGHTHEGHDHTHDDEHAHANHEHEHEGHGHPHGHPHPHEHGHSHSHSHGHGHGHGHSHLHGLAHGHGAEGTRSRRGLVGLGVAGGLVPSPSALVVLLGAIGLGRPVLGIVLVAAYGLGMAATLTAVGLVLVRVAGRIERVAAAGRGRLAQVARLTPVLTSTSVIALGVGMAVRGLPGAI